MQSIQAKSVLAKLLAEENISIEHRNVNTAAFDLEKRTMILPIWDDLSTELYDLLIGHETGHALNTPKQGWHNAVMDDRQMKSFLNIIEDARIERKQKERYAGLARSFAKGYRELMDRDFFGVKDLDVNTLPIADRVNLHFKVGSSLAIQFSDSERSLVNRIEKVQTWEEVVALAAELKVLQDAEKDEMQTAMDDLASQLQDLQNEMDQIMPPSERESDAGESEGEPEDAADEGVFGQPSAGDSDDVGEEVEDQMSKEEQYNGLSEDDQNTVDDIEEKMEEIKRKMAPMENALDGEASHTDESFRQNEHSLIDKDASMTPYYADISNVDYRQWVIDYKTLYANPVTGYADWATDYTKEKHMTEFAEWAKRQKTLVSSMAHTFFSKQKAHEMKRTRVAKTGEINTNKLWSYNTSEDIFLQKTLVDSGKNHGFIFYLDMSQSMYEYMNDTVHQLLRMVMFARKINVPFEVFGFTSASNYDRENLATKDDIGKYQVSDLELRNLFSSRMTRQEFDHAIREMYFFGKTFDNRNRYNRHNNGGLWLSHRNFSLGGTPLLGAMLAGIGIAQDFQRANNVEILNTMVLTDGEPTDRINIVKHQEDRDYLYLSDANYDEYPVLVSGAIQTSLKSSYRHVRNLKTVIEHYRKITGSRMYNYHIITGKKDLERQETFYNEGNRWNDVSEKQSLMLKQGYILETTHGWDYRFIIRETALKGGNMTLDADGDKSKLLTQFKKMGKGKKTERILAQKLAELVA